ncbi:hypothetical protein N9K86_02600 [Litoricolaceae bacterium]|nr:hypothetical protein [Litorivicinaceae bacterium]
MAVNTTQGIVLAIFGANAGGHLTSLDANGNASLATDLSAAAGLILGVDLSTDAAFTSTVLGNLGIAEDSAGYTLASNYFTTNLAAGAGRGDLVAAAVEYLLGSNVDASLTDSATAFSASVTAGVEYSQGEGASVFGVAQLQTAAGNTASAGEGSTFELTAEDDSFSGTAGNDTFTAAAGTLSADDSITDSSSTDNDTLNVTATTTVAMDVSNVENVNINWDGYATPTYDLADVSGATVTLSSAKQGYLGNANVDNAGSNNLVFGTGVDGDVTVDDNEDSTITADLAETVSVGATTAGDEGDGDVVVNAAVADTVTVDGGDSITVNALAADTVTVTGTNNLADVMTVNLGVDADLTATGATDAALNINSDADITVTLDAASRFETLTLGGAGAVELDINVTLANLATETAIVGGGVVTLGGTLGDKDLSLIEHTELRLEDTTTAVLNVKSGANIVLEADAAALTFATTDDFDTGADSITITLEAEQTTEALVFDNGAENSENDFETVNIVIDPNSDFVDTQDFNIGALSGNNVTDGSATNFVITSADDAVEVTIGASDAANVDATAVAGEFDFTQLAVDEDLTVVAAADETTANFTGTDADSTFISGNSADDTVTLDTTGGTAYVSFTAGDNTVTSGGVLTGTLVVEGGTGDDDVTLTAASTGQVVANLGDGDNTFTSADVGAGITAVVTAGSGDDVVTLDGAAADTGEITVDLGTGTNRIDLVADANLSGLTLSLTNVDIIRLAAGDTATFTATDTTPADGTVDAPFAGHPVLDSDVLDGASYTLQSSGAAGTPAATLGVLLDSSETSFDGSSLVISDSIDNAMKGLVIGHTDNTADYTIVGSDGDDTIFVGAGDDTVTGGEGADTITLSTGEDTVVLASGDSSPTITNGTGTKVDAGTMTGIDSVTGFGLAGDDTLDLPVAVVIAADTAGTDGTNSTAGHTGLALEAFIESHAIVDGLVTFDDTGTYTAAIAEGAAGAAGDLIAASFVDYLMANDIGDAGATVVFQAGTDSYVYQQKTTNNGDTDGATVIELVGVDATSVITSGTTAGGILVS